MSEVRCVVESKNVVGEGPLWDAEGQCLYWADINGMSVYRLEVLSRRVSHWRFTTTVSALALTSRAGWLLVSAGLQLLLWHVESDERVLLAQVEDGACGNRLNDGAADPEGNFWVGTMRNNVAPDGAGLEVDWSAPESCRGSLYRVGPDGSVRCFDTGFAIPNTMVWSPDQGTMYGADSISNVLYAYAYQEGAVSERRVLCQGFERGVPDGSAMDEEGFLWNCRYYGGCIVRFTPSGEVDRVVEMPVRNVTNCAFGGGDLRTLYVTTAADPDAGDDPIVGGVFAFEPGVRGVPESVFRLA